MKNSFRRRAARSALCLLASAALVHCDGKAGATGLAGTTSFTVSLSSLVLSAGTLAPVFDGATTAYTATVPNGTN